MWSPQKMLYKTEGIKSNRDSENVPKTPSDNAKLSQSWYAITVI